MPFFWTSKPKPATTSTKSSTTAQSSSAQAPREKDAVPKKDNKLQDEITRIDAAATARREITSEINSLLECFASELSLTSIKLKDNVAKEDADKSILEIYSIVDSENASEDFDFLQQKNPHLIPYENLQQLVALTRAYIDLYEPVKFKDEILPEKIVTQEQSPNDFNKPILPPPAEDLKESPLPAKVLKKLPMHELIVAIGGVEDGNSLSEIIRKLTEIKRQLNTIDFHTSNAAPKSAFTQAKDRFELSAAVYCSLPAMMAKVESKMKNADKKNVQKIYDLKEEIQTLVKSKMQGISNHNFSM